MTLKERLGGAITGLGVALISIPVALIFTILLVPFWSWLEVISGLESLGHSGPAEWCYLVVYLLMVSIGGLSWSLLSKKRPHISVDSDAQD